MTGRIGLQALRSAFFRPNVLFLPLQTDPERYEYLRQILRESARLKVGIRLAALLVLPRASLARATTTSGAALAGTRL